MIDAEVKMERRNVMQWMEQMMDLEQGTLKEDSNLKSIVQWDSMQILNFIAYIETKHHVVLDGAEIQGKKTVGELLDMVPGN
jgi:acyl carrier protein